MCACTCEYVSGHRCAHGSASVKNEEPEFTNYSSTKRGTSTTTYIGTLDYIFVSSLVEVESAIPLPSGDDKALLPNGMEPSDHLMVQASLRIHEEEVKVKKPIIASASPAWNAKPRHKKLAKPVGFVPRKR